MPVNDIYEARVEGVCTSGRRWNNVIHLRQTVETETDLYATSQALAERAQALYVNELMGQLAADHALLGARATRVFPTAGIPAVASVASPVLGGVQGESLPADVAMVVTKRTNKPGKKYLGRMYISGISETDQGLDTLITASQQGWSQALWDFFRADNWFDSADNEWEPVVFSKTDATADPPAPEPYAAITRIEFDITLRNQTRRGRRTRNALQAADNQGA